MADNYFAGRVAKFGVASASSVALTAVGKVTGVDVSVNGEPIPVTNFDSSGWREVIKGVRDWEVSFEAMMVSTSISAAHDTLRGYLSSETRAWFGLQNSTADPYGIAFQGFGYMSGWTMSGNTDDAQLFNGSITGDGAPTISEGTTSIF